MLPQTAQYLFSPGTRSSWRWRKHQHPWHCFQRPPAHPLIRPAAKVGLRGWAWRLTPADIAALLMSLPPAGRVAQKRSYDHYANFALLANGGVGDARSGLPYHSDEGGTSPVTGGDPAPASLACSCRHELQSPVGVRR